MANFWQSLTPWKEEKGETFGEAAKKLWYGGAYQPPPTGPAPVTGGPGVTIGGVTPTTEPFFGPVGQWPYSGAQEGVYPTTMPSGGRQPLPPGTPYTPALETMEEYFARIRRQAGEYGQYMQQYLTREELLAKQLWEQTLAARKQAQEEKEFQETQTWRAQEAAMTRGYQQQQLASEQAWRQQQLATEKEQRLAALAASPASWLEYAALAGQPPVIQPWMMPLMPQDYGIGTTGEMIPGWTPTSGMGMPGLTTPSTQYQARMGPTAQQQYYGYERARTAATPEETQFRLWSIAPPGGRQQGLTQRR